jgi:hypothetical protein
MNFIEIIYTHFGFGNLISLITLLILAITAVFTYKLIEENKNINKVNLFNNLINMHGELKKYLSKIKRKVPSNLEKEMIGYFYACMSIFNLNKP